MLERNLTTTPEPIILTPKGPSRPSRGAQGLEGVGLDPLGPQAEGGQPGSMAWCGADPVDRRADVATTVDRASCEVYTSVNTQARSRKKTSVQRPHEALRARALGSLPPQSTVHAHTVHGHGYVTRLARVAICGRPFPTAPCCRMRPTSSSARAPALLLVSGTLQRRSSSSPTRPTHAPPPRAHTPRSSPPRGRLTAARGASPRRPPAWAVPAGQSSRTARASRSGGTRAPPRSRRRASWRRRRPA